MIDSFSAVGYHGTDKKFVNSILKNIDYSFNKGDKFLGQGMYLWRDSYERALHWARKTKNFQQISVLSFKLKSNNANILNFTSNSWGNEVELLEVWLNNFSSKMAFGEFLDHLIYKEGLDIDLVLIIDLSKKMKTINIIDNQNETNFALGDIQICLKNNNPILIYGEI